MIDFLSYLPAKRKQTSSGWLSFNAMCCHHRGHKQDKRGRGGVHPTNDNGYVYSCFNCGFTASWIPGRMLGFKMRSLLGWLGVDQTEIERINLENIRFRSIHGLLESSRQYETHKVEFNEVDLPKNLELLDEENIKHAPFIKYLEDRCINPRTYPFMVSPNGIGRQKSRIVIPFSYQSQIVGHTARFLDNLQPKYLSDTQPGYVFGTELQKDAWNIVIVTEGVFDALAINGLALMHNDISPGQATLIRDLNKDIIVVPDADRSGMDLVDKALELGWPVSMPDWPENCKDINDAVKSLGKLKTLITILEARETSSLKIKLRKKKYVKNLRN